MAVVAPAGSYCFDTSIFIDGMAKRYPPAVFRSVWAHVERLISDGRITSPREVYEELSRHDDDVFNWVKARRTFISAEDRATQQFVSEIMARFPGFAAAGNERACADPFVIAMARARGLSVVSQEERVSHQKLTKPKIPNVCDEFNVDCLNLVTFLLREKIVM